MKIQASVDGIMEEFEVVDLHGDYILNSAGMHTSKYDKSGSLRTGIQLQLIPSPARQQYKDWLANQPSLCS